jgi:hypothetical protein
MDRIRFLEAQADECRRAAAASGDRRSRQALRQLASHYDEEARRTNIAGRPSR